MSTLANSDTRARAPRQAAARLEVARLQAAAEAARAKAEASRAARRAKRTAAGGEGASPSPCRSVREHLLQ